MSDSPKTTPLEWCPAMADAVHAWSIPDSKGVSECLWCYERRSADGQTVSPAKVTRADSEQPERKSTPKYEACGGCGAVNPSDRCIGCFHNFEPHLTPRTEKVREEYLKLGICAQYALSQLEAAERDLAAAKAERDRLRAALEAQEEAERAEEDHLAHLGGMGVAKSKADEDEERAKEFILGRLARKAAAKAKALRAAALSSETLAGSGSDHNQKEVGE